MYREVFEDESKAFGREDNYVRIKVLTEEGRKYADVEIPYLAEEVKIGNIHARTIKPDGTIVEFDDKPYTKTLAKARGFQMKAETFTLPAVQPGCILEYYYTMSGYSTSSWIVNEDLFTKTSDFSLKPIAGSLIFNRYVWTWQNMPPGTPNPTQDKHGILRMHVSNVPAFVPEEMMPPENEVRAKLDFNYSFSGLGPDPARFWSSFAKELNEGLEDFIGKPKSMEQVLTEIVGPNDHPEVKLQKIYARVQQMRNTSFEIEKTLQEEKRSKEKESNKVQDVWKKGYGGHLELNRVFLSLLHASGFQAY